MQPTELHYSGEESQALNLAGILYYSPAENSSPGAEQRHRQRKPGPAL